MAQVRLPRTTTGDKLVQDNPECLKRSWLSDLSKILTLFASSWVSVPLGIIATSLAIAYFVVFMVTSFHSMYGKFVFAPISATPDVVCKILLLTVV